MYDRRKILSTFVRIRTRSSHVALRNMNRSMLAMLNVRSRCDDMSISSSALATTKNERPCYIVSLKHFSPIVVCSLLAVKLFSTSIKGAQWNCDCDGGNCNTNYNWKAGLRKCGMQLVKANEINWRKKRTQDAKQTESGRGNALWSFQRRIHGELCEKNTSILRYVRNPWQKRCEPQPTSKFSRFTNLLTSKTVDCNQSGVLWSHILDFVGINVIMLIGKLSRYRAGSSPYSVFFFLVTMVDSELNMKSNGDQQY